MLSIIPKIPEISVGSQMERSVSISSYRNIQDHLSRWSTCFSWKIPNETCRSIFEKPVHCSSSLHLCKEFKKGINNVRAIPIGWPGLIGKCRSIFLGYSRWVSDQSVWRIAKALRAIIVTPLFSKSSVFKMFST